MDDVESTVSGIASGIGNTVSGIASDIGGTTSGVVSGLESAGLLKRNGPVPGRKQEKQ